MLDRNAWTYISGRTAALETTLAGIDFYAPMAEQSPEEAVGRLGRTRFAQAVPEKWSFAKFSSELERIVAETTEDVASQCPHPSIALLVNEPRRARAVHARLNEMPEDVNTVTEIAAFLRREASASAVELSEMMLDEIDGLAADAGEASIPEGFVRRAASLAVDSIFLSIRVRLAEDSGAQAVADYVRAEVALRAGLVVIRSVFDAHERELAGRFFFRGELAGYRPDYSSLGGKSGHDELLAAALEEASRVLPPEMVRRIGEIDGDVFEEYEPAALKTLNEILEPLRLVPFGPERVFAFLLDLEREARAARIVLAGGGEAKEEVLRRIGV